MPISAGRMMSPRETTFSPRLTSSPAARMSWPSAASVKILTFRPSFSVSSIRITASAPSGIGAPVMIRAAWPLPTAFRGIDPAGMSSTTSRMTGFSRVAPPVSLQRRA